MRDQLDGVSVAELEREIDLGALWARLAVHWWLLVGGVVVGAAAGVLLLAGTGKTFEANTLLYLGQPFTPGTSGASQIQSLATNPRTVSKIIHSEAALKRASEASGLSVGQLRGQIRTLAVTAPNQPKNVSPLEEIIVAGPSRLKVEKAATALAQATVSQLSVYVDKKIRLLQTEFAAFQASLNGVNVRIADALRLQGQALRSTSLGLADRFLIQANANTALNFYTTRQQNLRHDLAGTQELLSLAEQVERSRIVEPAVAMATGARSRRNSFLLGALIGLLLGTFASYLAAPPLTHPNPRTPT